jgi:hypothetical protein
VLAGTPVRLASGQTVPIERLKPGERVAALDVEGLDRDVPCEWGRAQYQWLRQRAEAVLTPVAGTVASVKVGTHDGFVTINGRLRLTPEHPVLLNRGDEVGFVSAEFVLVGDSLVRHDLSEERIETITRAVDRATTVAVHVPGLNVFLADGVWVHNDMPPTQATGSGPQSGSGHSSGAGSSSGSGLGSGSGKASGSSMPNSGSTSGSGNSSGSDSGSDSGSGSPGSGSGSGVAHQSVALGVLAGKFIEGGVEGVPPAKWQQSGLSSEEEVKS